eukprot:603908-Lingulodinium_polyedra.AAC.1
MEVLQPARLFQPSMAEATPGPKVSPTFDLFKSVAAARAKFKPRSRAVAIAPPRALSAAIASASLVQPPPAPAVEPPPSTSFARIVGAVCRRRQPAVRYCRQRRAACCQFADGARLLPSPVRVAQAIAVPRSSQL